MNRAPWVQSIGIRVALAAFLSLAAVLGITGFAVDRLNRRRLLERLDERLKSEAASLAVLTKYDGERIDFDFEDETMPAFSEYGGGAYFQISDERQILECSRSLGGRQLPVPKSPEDRWVETIRGPFEESVRQLTIRVIRRDEQGRADEGLSDASVKRTMVRVQVARTMGEVARQHADERQTLWIVLPLGLGLGSLSVFLVARRATAPIRRFTSDARAIAAQVSDLRLNADGVDGELQELGQMINSALDRLAAAAERERRFAGDAAHELRTPVAAAQARLELALLRERTPKEYRETVAAALTATRRLGNIIESLLVLARCDPGGIQRTRLNLKNLVDRVIEEFSMAHPNLEIHTDLPASLQGVEGNERLLSQLLSILLENAVRHGQPPVDLVVTPSCGDEERLNVSVLDRGPGFPEDVIQRLGESFLRFDRSRSRRTGGSGLGLALAVRIAEAHGATLTIAQRAGGGAAVAFDLKCAPATELRKPS